MDFRWTIFSADLNPVVGSEQGKTRPVLVVSQEDINQILPVVNVLPITSRKEGRRIYANEVSLPPNVTGLRNESIVLCYQIRTLDKSRLRGYIGRIEDEALQENILAAMRFQLGL
ncbi:MAG TPA: type II toxin-antitoxin system PemK/MazF family toxin [Candidatus Hydrogenedentes bacterium]|nr:type II toxin-antitoxin system PemK/MazF family toxin [Candidatus Hydrogenedentota bacterium]